MFFISHAEYLDPRPLFSSLRSLVSKLSACKDSHIEATPGWIEPLLARIKEPHSHSAYEAPSDIRPCAPSIEILKRRLWCFRARFSGLVSPDCLLPWQGYTWGLGFIGLNRV